MVATRRPRWRSFLGNSGDRAVSTARSSQPSRGFELPRRDTATCCHSASISASFDAEDLAGSTSQDNTTTPAHAED